ncbi:hypothetical protein [Nocardioides palaemonis]|uniref:hypothetical protein n=1 Tax=Nocardioides palaemonis TaxID=2829810 RepID=UPI002012722F|nr:hypothetical protein [Nocardioides palaemonis]
MSPETDLRDRLEQELAHLPATPPEHYLRAGRRVRRRRRAVAVAGAVAASVAVVQLLAPGGGSREGSLAEQPGVPQPTEVPPGPDPDFVAPAPNNPVEAVDGLEGVDWFTSSEIPAWASEAGRHGPVATMPDGRLWVAPEATVRRTVVDPFVPGELGITASYAVEVECSCLPEDMTDGIGWVLTSSDGRGAGPGSMWVPGWSESPVAATTDDFELWVDEETARDQGRPPLAERFAHFADGTTGRMVAGAPGVTVIHQEPDAYLGSGRVTHTRAGAAEVSYAGQTFWVVGVDPEQGPPYYRWWPAERVPDFDAFLTMLRGNW